MEFNDLRQSNGFNGRTPEYPPQISDQLARRRRRGWLWAIPAIFVIIAVFAFGAAVYSEISGRDAELKSFLKSAQQGTSGDIIENQLLSGLSGAKISSSSTPGDPASAVTGADAAAGPKDRSRLTAEKSGRPELGNASSSLVIVEFADFQCPVCLKEFPIIREISNRYAKDVRFIFRNYPVIDQNSMMFAEAGMCALEQGKFWPFHDRMYSSQGQIANLEQFKALAVMSGLNWNKLQECVNAEKYKPQIMEDMSDALDLGVRGTPSFFINGKKLEGAVDAAAWESIIVKYKELTKQL